MNFLNRGGKVGTRGQWKGTDKFGGKHNIVEMSQGRGVNGRMKDSRGARIKDANLKERALVWDKPVGRV
jgi:hypothetical protein